MQECVTEALVLLKEPFSEYDARITLYTRLNGKLWAKAKSVRKITSKLNAHLEPGMVTLIRLTTRKDDHVGKDLNWYLTDSLNEFRAYTNFEFLESIARLIPDHMGRSDLFWNFLMKGEVNWRGLYSNLGYQNLNSTCMNCGEENIAYFSKSDETFIGAICALNFPDYLLLQAKL